MSGQHVGRRVIVKGHGPGTAIAWTDSPCYLVELDGGLRMMVGEKAVRAETIDDYIAAAAPILLAAERARIAAEIRDHEGWSDYRHDGLAEAARIAETAPEGGAS